MKPLDYAQNALLLGAVFAIYGLTGSWLGILLLGFWISP